MRAIYVLFCLKGWLGKSVDRVGPKILGAGGAVQVPGPSGFQPVDKGNMRGQTGAQATEIRSFEGRFGWGRTNASPQ